MLTKQQLIGIAVAMTRSNQLAALKNPSFPSNEICLYGDAPLFRRMVAITKELYDSFDYSRTPEFLKTLEGKSEAYKSMSVKLITPVKKTELLERYSDTVAGILESD